MFFLSFKVYFSIPSAVLRPENVNYRYSPENVLDQSFNYCRSVPYSNSEIMALIMIRCQNLWIAINIKVDCSKCQDQYPHLFKWFCHNFFNSINRFNWVQSSLFSDKKILFCWLSSCDNLFLGRTTYLLANKQKNYAYNAIGGFGDYPK